MKQNRIHKEGPLTTEWYDKAMEIWVDARECLDMGCQVPMSYIWRYRYYMLIDWIEKPGLASFVVKASIAGAIGGTAGLIFGYNI